MRKNSLLIILMIALSGIVFPALTGLYAWHQPITVHAIGQLFYFTFIAFSAWLGCRLIHSRLRQLPAITADPFLKAAALCSTTIIYSVSIAVILIMIRASINGGTLLPSGIYQYLSLLAATGVVYVLLTEVILLSKQKTGSGENKALTEQPENISAIRPLTEKITVSADSLQTDSSPISNMQAVRLQTDNIKAGNTKTDNLQAEDLQTDSLQNTETPLQLSAAGELVHRHAMNEMKADPYPDQSGSLTASIRRRNRLLVKKGLENLALLLDDIVLFYTESKVVYAIDRTGKKYMVDRKLNELELSLGQSDFFRANRQYLVSINYIKGFRTYEKVKLQLALNITEVEHSIIISQETAPAFRKWINDI